MHITKEMQDTIKRHVKGFINSGMSKNDIINYMDGFVAGFVEAHPVYRKDDYTNFYLMRYNYKKEFEKQWGRKHGKK